MLHKNSLLGNRHGIHNWEVVDAAAREALAVTSADHGKIAWQQDNNTMWFLANATGPVWVWLQEAVPLPSAPIEIATADHDILASQANRYLRFTSAAVKTGTFVDTEAYEAGMEFTIANRGATEDLTLSGTGITLNPPTNDSLILAPANTVKVKFLSALIADVYGDTAELPPAGDEYFADVSLLLHGDGADASTVFTDSSSHNQAMTRTGDTQISTAQSQFGGSSIRFDGSGDMLAVPAANHLLFTWGADPFTIETFIRFAALGDQHLVDQRHGGDSFNRLGLYITTSNITVMINGSTNITGSTTLAIDTWYHLAICRDGANMWIFLDGVQDGIKTNVTTTFTCNTSDPFVIGRAGFSLTGTLNAWIDEFRVTKGVARYTAPFTPPDAPFPDS